MCISSLEDNGRPIKVCCWKQSRNGVKSLRSDVPSPCWVETSEAGRTGAAKGISGRVIFADFSSSMPGKKFRKYSDFLHLMFDEWNEVFSFSIPHLNVGDT
jgi:hypothetical protein